MLPRFLLVLCCAMSPSLIFAEPDRPNIILLLADDLGYGDLSSFGSPAVQTPNLDRLGEQGVRSPYFHSASAVCSPTRASILTGRYPRSYEITRHFNDVNMWLPRGATTVAEILQRHGYATAHIGKWHLGGLHVDENGRRLTNQPGPRQHGFDHYQTQIEQQPLRGQMGRDRTVFREGGTVLIRNDQHISGNDPYFKKHFTDANGDHAVELIERFAGGNKLFFLNVWWLVPHTPYEPAPEPHWSATAADNISDDQHRFRSMMQHMDAKVGDILDALDRLGIADNTLVVFTSDNGAAWEGHIGNLKGGKTDLHDGGIRVPMVARWPAKIPAGSATHAFGHSADLLPTFCAAANVSLPDAHTLDGVNLLPHLSGGPAPSATERGMIFWQMDLYKSLQRHYPKPEPYATEVVREGRWKLLAFEGDPVELFNTQTDPTEEQNLLEQEPVCVERMTAALREWLAKEPIVPLGRS